MQERRADDQRINMLVTEVAVVKTEIDFMKKMMVSETADNKDFKKYVRGKLETVHGECVSKDEHDSHVKSDRWMFGICFTAFMAMAGVMAKVLIK